MADATIEIDECCCEVSLRCCYRAPGDPPDGPPQYTTSCFLVENPSATAANIIAESWPPTDDPTGTVAIAPMAIASTITIDGRKHCILQQFFISLDCVIGTGEIAVTVSYPNAISAGSTEDCTFAELLIGAGSYTPNVDIFDGFGPAPTPPSPYNEPGVYPSLCDIAIPDQQYALECFTPAFHPEEYQETQTTSCAIGDENTPLEVLTFQNQLEYFDPYTGQTISLLQQLLITPSVNFGPRDGIPCASQANAPDGTTFGAGGNMELDEVVLDCCPAPYTDYWENGTKPHIPPMLGPTPCCPSGQQTASIAVVFTAGGGCTCANGSVAEMIFDAHYTDVNAGWFNAHAWRVATILCGAFFNLTLVCNPDTGTGQIVEWSWNGASVAAAASFPCTGQGGGGTVFSVTGLTTIAGFPCNGSLTIEIIV